MRILTGFLFKNWAAILLFIILIAGWGWIKSKNNKIEEQAVSLTDALEDVEYLEMLSFKKQGQLDSIRILLVNAKKDIKRDSLDCVRTVQGVQSVVAALQKERVKLQNENVYLRNNPVRIDLIEYKLNVFGKIKDSTYTQAYRWEKD